MKELTLFALDQKQDDPATAELLRVILDVGFVWGPQKCSGMAAKLPPGHWDKSTAAQMPILQQLASTLCGLSEIPCPCKECCINEDISGRHAEVILHA